MTAYVPNAAQTEWMLHLPAVDDAIVQRRSLALEAGRMADERYRQAHGLMADARWLFDRLETDIRQRWNKDEILAARSQVAGAMANAAIIKAKGAA